MGKKFGLALVGSLIAGCLWWAIVTFLHGNYLTAVLSVGLAAWWSVAAALQFVVPAMVGRVACDGSGTTVRPDRRLDRLMLISTVAGTPILGLCAIFSWLGKLELPVISLGSYHSTPSWIPLAFAAVTVVWIVFLVLIVRLRGIGYIRLDLDTFKFAEAFRKTQGGRWSDVIDINETAPEGRYQATRPLTVEMDDGHRYLIDNYALYSPALFELIRFYWLRPEDRVELTDGRGVQRFYDMQSASGPGTAS
ncbi:hypothetical protein [Mycobacterium syngnathidarum]